MSKDYQEYTTWWHTFTDLLTARRQVEDGTAADRPRGERQGHPLLDRVGRRGLRARRTDEPIRVRDVVVDLAGRDELLEGNQRNRGIGAVVAAERHDRIAGGELQGGRLVVAGRRGYPFVMARI